MICRREIIGSIPRIDIADIRCPGVIIIGFNDCGFDPGISIRGHTLFRIIKIRFTNYWNCSNGGIGLVSIYRKIIDKRNAGKLDERV